MALKLRKALLTEGYLRGLARKSLGDKKLAYFKRRIIAYLKSQEDEEPEPDAIEKAIYGIGTIRTWKGKKYIKGHDKKWRRYYDKEDRGARISIKNLIKKVEHINSAEELMNLVMLHRDRFADEYGHPISIVQELSRYVRERGSQISQEPSTHGPAVRQAAETAKKQEAVSDKEPTYDGDLKADFDSGKVSPREIADYLKARWQWDIDHPVRGPLGDIAAVPIKIYGTTGQGWEKIANWVDGIKNGTRDIMDFKGLLGSFTEMPKEIRDRLIKESEEEKHRNRSESMKGNQNAKKDGATDGITAARQMKAEQQAEKKARKKADMPPVEEGERSSAMEDSTWDPKSKNYRYRDTGYIAGSRKEMAESYIKRRAKEGIHINVTDIDWQAIEENPRQAKLLITKSNIFGKVDWGALQESGMTGGAGFLVDRVYASVGSEPEEDKPDARKYYSIAIDGLRARLEKCKTVEEVTETIKEIRGEMNGDFVDAENAPEVMELTGKLKELYSRRIELQQEERSIMDRRNKTELDKKADDFFEIEAEKVKAKDKRKKRVSEYDFPKEVREKYNELTRDAMQDRTRRANEFRERNGYLDDEKLIGPPTPGWPNGEYLGFRSRGYFYNEIKELEEKRKALYLQKATEIVMSNPLHLAWTQLGEKFRGVLNYGHHKGSDTFYNHVAEARRGKYDDWQWSQKEKTEVSRKGQKRRVEFELKVASTMDRKGGRAVKAGSTLELKNHFNLRDVQSGNWVLNDPESAKFHVDNIAAGLADLSDITGIPDNLVSMNGRLAIAIGARGTGNAGWKGAAKAHYESVQRVINITKMKGGGSLAHEWFHAFDNLISEAMTGGNIDRFLTDPNSGYSKTQLKLKEEAETLRAEAKKYGSYQAVLYERAKEKAEQAGVTFPEEGSEEEYIQRVRDAFSNLVKSMVTGDLPLKSYVSYTDKDYQKAQYNFGHNASQFSRSIREAGSLDRALDIVYEHFSGSSPRTAKNKKEWVAITVAYYDKHPNGNAVYAKNGQTGSFFKKGALDLDAGGSKEYYATLKEMAARAFAGYIDDKLRNQGRLNDYLAYATTNDFYIDPVFGPEYPYPEGEERERINAAFDELFKVVKETGAIRKAIKAENNMRIVFFRKAQKTKEPDDRLEEFKRLILEHLNSEHSEDDEVKKAGLPVGTIRTWKGKDFVKVAPGKWRPKYNSETRGAKMAVSAIKKKVDAAKTAKELMDIVMENRERFSDANGNPLPFVQDLHKYVNQRQEYLPENIAAKRKEARSNAIKAGEKKARENREADNKGHGDESGEGVRNKSHKEELKSLRKDVDEAYERLNNLSEELAKNYGDKATTDRYNAAVKDWQEKYEKWQKFLTYEDFKEIEQGNPSNDDSQENIDLNSIREKYQNSKSIEGSEDEIYVGDEALKGRWKLVEADAPAASHDETTFHKTRGFPINKDGSTINDRDYQNDRAAQETVMSMGSNFDGRALSFDSPVVVTQDGIVVSGNNRTMSSKIAARNGADTKYVDALKKRAARFGFTAENVGGFIHPRVVFEIEKKGGYSTGEFAKYNQESQKTMSPIEAAVKVSKIIKPETVKDVAGHIADFDTMGELYADHKTCMNIFNTLETGGIINQFNRNTYIDPDGVITGAGKEFLETVLIGSVVNEQNIRGLNREGCKHIRSKLVRAITPLVNNKSMGGYSIMEELNQAIDLFMQFNIEKDKFGTLDDLVKQGAMFEEPSGVAVELARKMQMNQKDFAEFMQKINANLELGASGQSDIFLGDVETKDDILKRFLEIKKSIEEVIRNLRERKNRRQGRMIQKSSGAGELESFDVALDFDGVINSYKNGWKGETETDDPVEGAAEGILKLLETGLDIVIYSTRAGSPEGKATIRDYLRELIGDKANNIKIADGKPIAAVYVDDRAVTFSGNWEEMPEKIEKFKSWLDKSLTWSGHKLQGRTKIQGMDISIENKKGSVRSGTDKDGHDWAIKMAYPYGYIRGTIGVDGDHLDCYLGPNPESRKVFIVNQNDPTTGKFDEQKVMLGFDNLEEAKEAYLRQYDRPGFLGDIEAMEIEEFKEKAFSKENKWGKIA